MFLATEASESRLCRGDSHLSGQLMVYGSRAQQTRGKNRRSTRGDVSQACAMEQSSREMCHLPRRRPDSSRKSHEFRYRESTCPIAEDREITERLLRKLGQAPRSYAKSLQNTNIRSEPVPFLTASERGRRGREPCVPQMALANGMREPHNRLALTRKELP